MTVLFADVVGFTARAEQMDPEDVRRFLQPLHARLRSELERRGGTVEKFIGDAVMAVFGAPVVHEDDPERAVRAALAILEALAEDGDVEVRIGITTGEALIALEARPDAGEGIASGDVVNTAARLQSAAPAGGILVDAATHRASERAIEYAEGAPVVAKGKAEPVAVWQALRARTALGAERPRDAAGRADGGANAPARDARTRAARTRAPAHHASRRPGNRQEPAGRGAARGGARRRARALASGPLAALRRGGHLLGARGDGQRPRRDPRIRHRGRDGREALPGRDRRDRRAGGRGPG